MDNKTQEYWKKIMTIGKKQEKGQTNPFNKDDVTTIVGTMEFFNATDIWIKQTVFDLTIPKFKLYDWLCMCIMSRNDDDRVMNNNALKVLINAYIKVNGVPSEFIKDLRETDYQIDTSWEKIEVK